MYLYKRLVDINYYGCIFDHLRLLRWYQRLTLVSQFALIFYAASQKIIK